MKMLKYSNPLKRFFVVVLMFGVFGFWGCEKEEVHISSNAEHIDLSTYVLSEMTESDFQKLSMAMGRIDVSVKHGLYRIKQKSGYQINVSEQLFSFIKEGFEGTNQTILNSVSSESLNAPTRRLMSTSQEGGQGGQTSSNDCMAYAISALSGTSLITVKNRLTSTYGTDGVPINEFDAACRIFVPNGQSGGSGLLNHGPQNNTIIVFQTSASNAHAVNAQYVDSSNGIVLYHDYQSNQTNFVQISSVIKVFKTQ